MIVENSDPRGRFNKWYCKECYEPHRKGTLEQWGDPMEYVCSACGLRPEVLYTVWTIKDEQKYVFLRRFQLWKNKKKETNENERD